MIRQRAFITLIITQTLSMIGSRMSGIAIGFQIFAETGQTAPLLLFSFFNELPAMIAGSFAGVLVDRMDRKTVIMLSDSGQALGSLILAFSFTSGNFQLWHLYAVGLWMGTCAMFQGPAQSAVITQLIPDAYRDRANGLRAMTFPFSGVVAPAMTGALYPLIGIAGIIALDLVTFVVAVAVIYLVTFPPLPIEEEDSELPESMWQQWREGWRILRAYPGLFTLIIYLTIMNFLLNGPLELSIPYLVTVTGSESQTGLILAMNSLGGFIGAGLIASRTRIRERMRTAFAAFLVVGFMMVVYGLARSPLILAGAIFTLMVALQAWTLFTSVFQVKLPPRYQGRVFAIIDQFGYLGATLSFVLIGPLVDRVLKPEVGSSRWAAVEPIVGANPGAEMGLVLVGAGAAIVIMTLLMVALPYVRQIETRLADQADIAPQPV